MGLLWFWKRRQRHRERTALQIVLFTREGCHLCQTAWEQLQKRQRELGFTVEVVDVDRDSDLAARFGNDVPVVTVDGKVRFRGTVNEVLLDRLIRAETGWSAKQE